MYRVNQTGRILKLRKKKIIIIFVCRTYDLENDNNINSLFKKKKSLENVWEIIKVGDFKENVVKDIIGENYEHLSLKLKRLLRIPSNLYIWQHLDKKEDYGDCLTTSHLIDKWFEQICRKGVITGLQQRTINETKISIVDALERTGRLYVPKQILHVEEAGLDYLLSSEIIVSQNNRVGFVHQSILDYFMSQRMMEKYFDRQTIENIIGEKCRQSRRMVWAFVHYIEKSAVSVVDYADIIIQLCENVLQMEIEDLRKQWGIEDEISKLIISLYDETANSSKMTDKQIADKCLNLWDIMFERQLGSVRKISRQLMER